MQTKVSLTPAFPAALWGLWLGTGCWEQDHRAWHTCLRWPRAEPLALAAAPSLPTAGHKGLRVREFGPMLTNRNTV